MNRRNGTISHVTIIQVARLVGVARQSVQGRIAAGKLPTVEYAGEPMVRVEDVEVWRRERRDAAEQQLAKVTA